MGYVMLDIRPNNQLALQLGAKVDARGLVITDANGELRFRIYLSLEICGQTNLYCMAARGRLQAGNQQILKAVTNF
jgi:hypothetical protein